MRLTEQQAAEIETARTQRSQTARPTVAALEDLLYQALPVLDHGFVRVIDYMGDDSAIVQAARVSYGRGTRRVSEDAGLIRYLMRHRHSTPFEMCEIKYHVKLPIFVARQWIRHRTANVNEYSARYSIVPDRFYKPTLDQVRKQSTGNRQGGEERFRVAEGIEASRHQGIEAEHRTAEEFLRYLDDAEAMYERYEGLTKAGVSREMARIALPVSVYTEWYWKCDLHNIFHFLSLRMDEHAQVEIRDYANAMFALIQPIVPIAAEAFMDYNFGSMHLSKLEVEAIKSGRPLGTENKRELAEWDQKRKKLGLE